MTEREFVNKLIPAVVASFEHAYEWHRRGMSVDAILIQHDIIAAYALEPLPIVKLHRRAIRSACGAFDAGVPLDEARAFILKSLREQAEKQINDGT